ncbi:MAG: (2Fe-2S)-binding protein, partial [Ahrensia sp.]|nr:(2Fe-2S)-binding protein [Ahrensia sp.]
DFWLRQIALNVRYAWFDGERLVCMIFISNEPVEVSRVWAVEQLSANHTNLAARALLVAGRPGKDMPDRGPIVCSCFSVGAHEIAQAISQGCNSVAAIGVKLKAGTNCGSCKSEISGIINGQISIAAQ